MTDTGDVLHTVHRATRVDGPGTVIKTLLSLVEEVAAVADQRGLVLDGVGVGVLGIIDVERGMLPVAAPGNSVRELRASRSPTRSAASRACRPSSRTTPTRRGLAGEMRSMIVKLDGERCMCGARGCLGLYVGGRVIAGARAERARGRRPVGGARSRWDAAAVTSVHVFEAAAAGDALARRIVDQACTALGAGIASVIGCVDPDMIVVTGGVAQSLMPLADEVRSRVADYALTVDLPLPRIGVVGSDKNRTVRGGAALFLYHRARGHAARR